MRIGSNRLLVSGPNAEEGGAPQSPNIYARRRLAEIIFGLLIVFICIYLFIPVYTGTAESARRTICVSHLRRLAQALEMYQGDYDGQYPTSEGAVPIRALWSYVIQPDTEAEADLPQRRIKRPRRSVSVQRGNERRDISLPDGGEVFFCPSENDADLPRRRNVALGALLSSYTYRRPAVSGDTSEPFGWDYLGGTGSAAHPNGGNVAYLDGRVRWLAAAKWSAGDQP